MPLWPRRNPTTRNSIAFHIVKPTPFGEDQSGSQLKRGTTTYRHYYGRQSVLLTVVEAWEQMEPYDSDGKGGGKREDAKAYAGYKPASAGAVLIF